MYTSCNRNKSYYLKFNSLNVLTLRRSKLRLSMSDAQVGRKSGLFKYINMYSILILISITEGINYNKKNGSLLY